MAKEELIQFEGLVTEILPDARYRGQLDAGHDLVAYPAGKMKKNRIKTLARHRRAPLAAVRRARRRAANPAADSGRRPGPDGIRTRVFVVVLTRFLHANRYPP